jgi:aldehyde:ferredoxin oxidoreductase
MGKLLFMDLPSGETRQEGSDEKFYRDSIRGCRIGARILCSSQKGGADSLGPDNILGLITGPLTGTPAIGGCGYGAVEKSPLNGWNLKPSYIVPVKKESEKILSFLKTASYKTVPVLVTLILLNPVTIG